jgi:muramidase (phage lysozyme)
MPIRLFGSSWSRQNSFRPDTSLDLNDGSYERLEGTQSAYSGEGMQKMLQLIGRAEAGQAGYNQIWGGRAKSPITNMTLDEVLDYQDEIKASGSPSTAVGRYQFLKGTLTGLKKEMGLSGDEKMTPELQDALAIRLMRRRGLDRYLKGELDQKTFTNRLAMEWAGLPTTAGSSYYSGDGLNKANVPLESVLGAAADLLTRSDDFAGGSGVDDLGGGEGLDRLDSTFLAGLRGAENLGLGGTALKLYNDIVQRGRTEAITENDLSADELSGYRKIVERKIAETGKKKGKIDYRDYKGDADSNVLGGFSYSVNEDGEIEIFDKWDFNSKTATSDSESTVLKALGMFFAPYHLASQVGRKTVPPEKGIDVKIKLPASTSQ